jgi:L-arabinose isomerase
MFDYKQHEVWFVTGSQHLYGAEALQQVAANALEISKALTHSSHIPTPIVFKPVVTTPEAIYELCLAANAEKKCIGLVIWMHTFSPAKMWIAGLTALQKPFLHLHTQFNSGIPWSTIDMDFMNLNQSAHGDREFGYIGTRMRLKRKVVVGHWKAEDVQAKIGIWERAACAWNDAQGARIARFGDNMRDVAVTEGDKVEAQIQFGYSVNGYGIGDLLEYIDSVKDVDIDTLTTEYDERYTVAKTLQCEGKDRQSLKNAARIELGLRNFLEEGGFKAFTDTFEDLHGLVQLPGIAIQRLMADGYGFGAEGDWKTAALVRAMKVMGAGLKGGTSFMEDYTYDMQENNMKVLGAHMLEICESIADGKPSAEIHPLSIGGKANPVRLVFNTPNGRALVASMIELGERFRLIINEVDVVPADEPLSNLPVARTVWKPRPDLISAATAWIMAGGAHHTCFSQAVTSEYLEDFAEIAGVEYLLINNDTQLSNFKKEMRWNDVYYRLEQIRR